MPGGLSTFHPAGVRKYFANTSWMMLEKAVNFALTLTVSILLARHLGAADFGLLQYALSVVGLFALVTTLGLDVVLSRELVRRPNDSGVLLGTAFALRTAAVCLLFAFLGLSTAVTGYDGPLRSMLFILGFAYVPQVFGILELYFQARVLARVAAVANVTANAAAALFAIVAIGVGVPLEYFAGIWLIEACVFAVGLWIGYRSLRTHDTRWTFDAALARGLLAEGWPLMFSLALVSIYANIDRVMVRAFLGDEATGLYAAAARLSDAWYIVPTVVVNSLFPAVVGAKDTSTSEYHRRLQSLYDLMVWLAVAAALPVTFLSDTLMATLYGQPYRVTGIVLSIQLWTGILVFLGVASGRWFILEGYTRGYFLRSLVGVFVNVTFNLFLIPRYGILGAALATLVAQIAVVIGFDALVHSTRVSFWMKCRALVPVHRLKPPA